MKKFLILFLLLITSAQPIFARSIFKSKEETYTDKTLPFFINIYSNNTEDVKSDFDELKLNFTPQILYFNKKIEKNKPPKDDKFFVSAIRSKTVNNNFIEYDTVELMTNYKYGNWDFESSISQDTASGFNEYSNYISIKPIYRFNDNCSVFSEISHAITDKYDQTSLGIRFNPFKFKRVEFEVSVSNYTKQFYNNYRQKLKFNTIFKL